MSYVIEVLRNEHAILNACLASLNGSMATDGT